MERPKLLELPLDNQSIEFILRHRQLEGQFAHHQSEHQHSQGKNVAQLTIIPPLRRMMTGMYLRCHVPLTCPLVLSEKHPSALPLKVPRKPEITQFNGQLALLPEEKDVLQLEVPMSDALAMQVGDSLYQLSEESLLESERGCG